MSGGGDVRFLWADEAHFPAVRELWRQGFPTDTDEEIAAFWRAMSGVAQCLLCMQGDEAVSMAFLLPAHGCGGQRRVPLWYVYAAATRCDRRGEGLFARLLAEAAARAAKNGVAGLFLRPAEPSLFGYYARQGFQPQCYAVEMRWQANELYSKYPPEELKTVESGYAAIRGMWLKRLGGSFVDWSPAVAELALEMAKKVGGGAVFGSCGAALCERDGDCLLVRELLCAPADRERLVVQAARRFPCQSILVNTPSKEGEGEVFGMLLPCVDEAIFNGPLYMGFALE